MTPQDKIQVKCLMKVTHQTSQNQNKDLEIRFELPLTYGEFLRNICVNCNTTPIYSDFTIVNAFLVDPNTSKLFQFPHNQALQSIPEHLIFLHAQNLNDTLTLKIRLRSILPSIESITQAFQDTNE